MNPANLSQPVQLILSEEFFLLQKRLRAREDDYRIAAAEAIMNGDDSKAEALLTPIKELVGVRKAFDAQAPVGQIVDKALPVMPAGSQTPWKRSGLAVTLFGRRIQGWNDACTFANAIQGIGCEKVAGLGLTMNYLPLVAKELRRLSHQRYSMQIEKRDDWFIVTHCNTTRKKQLLYQIKRRLGLDLLAEIVYTRSVKNN